MRTSAVFAALLLIACSDDSDESSTGAAGAGGTPSGMPTDCTYPDPTSGQGVDVGEILPGTLTWDGYRPGESSAASIVISELHDCDGTHGIHAILASTLQPETSASNDHAVAVRDRLPEWEELGIAVLFLLLNNPDGEEVTIDGVQGWRSDFGVEEVFVVADPDFALVSGGLVNAPRNHIVDPRSMEVIAIAEGHPFDATPLEALATENAP